MVQDRPTTPPAKGPAPSRTELTPEQVKRIEINRLKAKALRDQREADARNETASRASGNLAAGQKRNHDTISTQTPATSRDGNTKQGPAARPLDAIQPARNFGKYVEYDFSKMTDTKGGFLTSEDDPHNKALKQAGTEDKPAHMTLKEWERHQLLKNLREQKSGPFQPGMDPLKSREVKVCRECGSMEIDWKWEEIFSCAVCNDCKEKIPEKYSLLTKTEAKADYLLTDPELKDEELLPHLERPNPHKATFHNMMLFLRYQVEEYAFNKKWGSEQALDVAYETREADKKRRKEAKFKNKLQELKKRTRVEAYKRNREGGGGGSNFGDEIVKGGKHIHTWGRPIEREDGMTLKTCTDCGMEIEELEF